LSVDALAEVFYQGLMRCYDQVGQADQIEKSYCQLRQLLDSRLNTKPSSETRKLYNTLLNTAPE
jgi:DNA-binding SARP family transcriptional activator